MRNHPYLLAFVLVNGFVIGGCGAGFDGGGNGTVGRENNVALKLTAASSTNTHFEITAVDQASGKAAASEAVEVKAGTTSVVELSLPPAAYTFKASAFADAAETIQIGESSTSATVAADQTTDIQLAASANDKGGGSVTGTAHIAPRLDAVTIALDPQGNASVQVSASSAEHGALSLHVSGFGLKSELSSDVSGQASIALSAQAAAAQLSQSSHSLAIVVADEKGGAATAKIDFSPTANALFAAYSISVNGQVTSSVGGASGSADASGSAKIQACVDTHAQCAANCSAAAKASLSGAAAQASCDANCAVSLATCEAK